MVKGKKKLGFPQAYTERRFIMEKQKDLINVSIDEIVSNIITEDDFVSINGKIEPTRSFALKMFSVTCIERYNVNLIQVVDRPEETIYVCKAVVERYKKLAEGLGACSTKEIEGRSGVSRKHHDAIATAETRAMKRALEAVVGLPFINEIILKVFGDYQVVSDPIITPEELIAKIKGAKAIPHLKNIWLKYRVVLNSFSSDDRAKVIKVKEERKEELKNAYKAGRSISAE